MKLIDHYRNISVVLQTKLKISRAVLTSLNEKLIEKISNHETMSPKIDPTKCISRAGRIFGW